jgi:hypothetical protein
VDTLPQQTFWNLPDDVPHCAVPLPPMNQSWVRAFSQLCVLFSHHIAKYAMLQKKKVLVGNK